METATTTAMPFSFSDEALAALRAIKDEEGVSTERGLRVGVKGGGCSGMSYVLEFDNQTAHDEVYELPGLKILLDRRHALYLVGMHVEFQDGLNARGFLFQNPNAKTTCGCGTSFGA